MLAKKIECPLAATIIEPRQALDFSEERGAPLSFSFSWHRVADEKEEVDMAEFTFLLINDGKPRQIDVSYEKGEFTKKAEDLSEEMGDMSDEEEFARRVRFAPDHVVLNILSKHPRVKKVMKKAKHLRVYSLDFLIYDEDQDAPVWEVVLKNWPLTNYFKKEKPVTIEATVNALNGKVLEIEEYQ